MNVISLDDKSIEALERISNDPGITEYFPLTDIALDMFSNHADCFFTEICGPISTGPLGSTKASRLSALTDAINTIHGSIREDGSVRYVFDQTIFEGAIESIKKRRNLDCYDMAINEQFYHQLFTKVPNFNELIFMPEYEYSLGASAEHHSGLMLPEKMHIRYLLPDWKQRYENDEDFYTPRAR